MTAVVGSFHAELTYGDMSCSEWIDMQRSLTTPLISWEDGSEVGVVTRNFPKQMPPVRCPANKVRELTRDSPSAATQRCSMNPFAHCLLASSQVNATSPH